MVGPCSEAFACSVPSYVLRRAGVYLQGCDNALSSVLRAVAHCPRAVLEKGRTWEMVTTQYEQRQSPPAPLTRSPGTSSKFDYGAFYSGGICTGSRTKRKPCETHSIVRFIFLGFGALHFLD